MKKHTTLLETLLRYKQVLFIITGLLILVGIIALVQMPRDEFPTFEIRQGIIVGIYPGASSLQVEEQLTTKVEQYLFQYNSVDRNKTRSISKENVMVIYVEVSEKEKEPDVFWAKLRHGLNELKGQLPSGVLSLTADNDFGNTSALLLAVQSDTKTYKELEQYIKQFEAQIRIIPSVSKVKHYGLLQEQVNVYIDDAKLTQYGIKPLVVMAALKPQSAVGYAGEIDDGTQIYPIHIPLSYQTEEDVANQIVYSDPLGNIVRVKDVARVVREYEEPESFIRVNGKKCLIVSLEMQTGNNIVHFGKDVSKEISQFTKTLPPDVKIETISNIPGAVSKAIANFMKEFAIAIFSVILVTVILLPRRVAIVAASAIPISILITLAFMWVTGWDLQTVSLAALILVLGMVVDNAIVIIDNYVEKLDNGISPHDAASQSVADLFTSVLSATLILVACFWPIIFFMKGTAGDFVRSLPYVTSFALFISLFTSAVLVPLLSYMFIKTGIKNDTHKGKKAIFLDNVQKYYNNLLEKVFKNKLTVVLAGAVSFIIGLVILGISPQQSFPKIERNQFAVEVHLPLGSSLQQTDAVMKDLEELLQKDPRVKTVASFIGTSSPRFHTIYAPNFPAKSYGQLVVLTKSNKATIEILDEYSVKYANRYPNANVKWKQLEFAVSPSPIEVRLAGDDLNVLKQTANEISDIVRKADGVTWVRTDFKQSRQTIDLEIKKDEASRLGYSNMLLGYSLMVGTKGFPVATIWEGDYPVDVQLKVDKKVKTSIDDISNQYVTSPYLVASVPVRQIADLKPGWSEGEIIHRNGIRTITVQADVRRDAIPSTVFNKLRPKIEAVQLPEGVTMYYGGDYQDTVEYITPFYYSLMISIVIIFIILMFQFKSIKTSLLIMLTMPLCIFGASLGIFITGYPFGVTAFIGLIGLMGIVVRNGIIYISYAEELRHEHGHSLEEAATSAAQRRMRPIFLTAAAAAVGVIPMIASGSLLWGPLGAVICFGLIFALILSLLLMPVLYYLFHRNDFNIIEASAL
ncbi:MAG TPA: efflux RND transporter permease subunit [bacterium]|nr:efflux RND transporter permease subunit [bacterium]HPN43824.1 efflux RND transporter permease subunit [bacterium]